VAGARIGRRETAKKYRDMEKKPKDQENRTIILIDTNFLLIPCQFKVDIFSEINRICRFRYEICILKPTIRELENIICSATQKQKAIHKTAAKIALSLIKNKNINILPAKDTYLDQAILDLIKADNARHKYIIATQDIELKKKLRAQAVGIITLRQKKYLILEE